MLICLYENVEFWRKYGWTYCNYTPYFDSQHDQGDWIITTKSSGYWLSPNCLILQESLSKEDVENQFFWGIRGL
jgi:hypothetical protein